MFQHGCMHIPSTGENECPSRPCLLSPLVYYMKTWNINAGVKTKALGSCMMHEIIHPDSAFFTVFYISHSTDRCESEMTLELSLCVCVSVTEWVSLTNSHA